MCSEGLPIGWMAIMLAVLASMGGFIFGVSSIPLSHMQPPDVSHLSTTLVKFPISSSWMTSFSVLPTAQLPESPAHVHSPLSVKASSSPSSVSAPLLALSSVPRELFPSFARFLCN